MADLTDVENALVSMVTTAVYPNSTASPSVAGIAAMIYAGNPVPDQLDTDFSPTNIAPRAHINVNFLMDRDASDLLDGWQVRTISTPSLTLTVDNATSTITVGGTVSVPINCAIKVNAVVYRYAVQQADTLQTVATNIAALIPFASVVGTVITVPNAYQLITKTGSIGTAINAVGQQQGVFKITVLAPSFIYRTAFSKAIKGYLDANYRLTMPDSTGANMSYKGMRQFDTYQKTIIYRRDLMYEVTFYTTLVNNYYTIVDTPVNTTYVPNIP
jgi:hypothetical protein